jgi:glycosyltransferase involved in cell wall biosynthesis
LNIDNPTNSFETLVSQEREMYRQSDHIVSVTEYMKDFLVDEYLIDSHKITTIHNGLDQSKYVNISESEKLKLREKLGFRKNEIIILFSGRLDPCKGIFFLLDAFEEACKQNSDLRLVVLGGGSIEKCQKKIKAFFGKVTFTGFLSEETVRSFYLISDIGIVPSIYDHCPYTVLEMMASRLPIIISRISGIDEILSNKDCLFINPATGTDGNISLNIQELSETILTLASDIELRIRLSENSFCRFKKEFTSNNMSEKMFNLLHSLTMNNKKSI